MKRKTLLLMLLLALFSSGAWAQSAYYSYSNITSSYSGSILYNDGTPANLLDNSLSTKYCPQYRDDTWPTYSRVDFESNDLIIPTGYVIYTGDDTQKYPGRNPKNWTIQAKVNSSDSWTTIHTVTNAGLPTTNKTAVTYLFSNTTAYKYFRFEITAIENGGIGQLQDFHFLVGQSAPTWSGSDNYYISNFKVTKGSTTLLENPTSGTAHQNNDYYNTKTITASPGDALSCQITCYGYSNSTYGYAMWVDFDGNGLTSADKVFGTSSFTSSPYTGTLTIPANTPSGEYRVRILADHNTSAPSDPCGSYSNGESEDYKLNVVIAPASLPYTENFENGQNGWEFANGGYTNHWTIGTATSVSSSHSLYVTNGTANEYNNGTASYVYAYRELDFTAAGDYVVSFKWKAKGESGCWDAMYAALVPQGTACPPSSNITGSTNSLPGGYINASNASTAFLWTQSDWQTSTKNVSIPSAGVYTLVFYWKNDGSGGSNPPAAVDDIDIHADLPPITEISNVTDWEAFCSAVNNGHDYSGETVTLMNDITTAVTTMAGTISGETVGKAFKGTFDGQGHTLTLGISGGASDGWYFTAPFRCIDGATIKNLKTTGTVTQTGGKGAAGIVGCSIGNCTITNCVSNVTINSQTDGDGTHGGFISFIKSGKVIFNGCAFTGSITGSSTRYCGGFVGWNNGSTNTTFNNCVFAPTAITFDADYSGDNSANFSRTSGTFNNCYYTQTCGSVVQGKLMHSITGASGITVANAGTPTSYTPETSTIVGYGTGIKFNNILYAGSGENVSLTLTGASEYEADYGTLTGSGSSYTLTMAASNTVISSGISCAVPTNLQCTYYNRTSATLSWTRGGDETQWHVQYCPQGSTNPQMLYTTDNPYVLSLTEGHTYDIQVRAVCDNQNDVWSDWSNTITVTPQALTYVFTNNGSNGDGKWNTLTNWQYSDPNIAVTTLPTINDNVQINAACTIPSDCLAQANEITILTEAQGSITIEDGGQLQHNNNGVVVTIERVIPAYDEENEETNLGYKIISFPVSGIDMECECIEGLLTNTNTNTNPYDFYTFDYNNLEGNVYLEWRHVSTNDGLDPYKGYLYASQNGTTISVTGVVAPSVTQNYDLDYVEGVAPFNGWKLVGNPFVCNAYLTAQGSHMDFYEIQDKEEGYAEFFPIDPAVEIPPMGGVMVWLHENDKLVYSRTAPSKGPGILNMDVNKASMRGTTMLDRARVRFGEGRNLKKLQLNPRHTKLYIPEDGNDFSVYYAEGAGTIPVNFKAQDNGSYTLSFSTEDVGFNYLHLIDNMNGNDVDLLQTPYYTFDAKSTDFASRFTLVFATGNDNNDTFAFFNNGVWIINNPSTDSGAEATLQVVDVLGHILSSETISGSCSKAINVAPGVYMLRLVNGNDVKVQKIVVR